MVREDLTLHFCGDVEFQYEHVAGLDLLFGDVFRTSFSYYDFQIYLRHH